MPIRGKAQGWKPYAFTVVALEVCMLAMRFCVHGMRQAQVARLHDVINAQIVMSIFSVLLFRRVTWLFQVLSSSVRDSLKAIFLLFIILSHSSWFFFYVYVPDDSVICIVCFICLAAFLHAICFLSVFTVAEFVFRHVKLRPQIPGYLRSRNVHTMLSIFFAVLLTGAGLAVTQFSPIVRTVDVVLENLPPSMDGFSIALLADMHVGPTVRRRRVAQIVTIVNSLNPHAVAVVGDLVDGFVPYVATRALPLALLSSKFGTFFATGNHEYYHSDVDDWLTFFSTRLNMTILRNSHKKLQMGGGEYVCLAGVDDYITEKLHIPGHEMDAELALEGCDVGMPTVLLVHQPNGAREVLSSLPVGRVDLVLSGHTHGGQFYIFWLFAYFKNAYLRGLYKVDGLPTQIYVSPGVNYWGPPVKMVNLCEISLIRLRSSNG